MYFCANITSAVNGCISCPALITSSPTPRRDSHGRYDSRTATRHHGLRRTTHGRTRGLRRLHVCRQQAGVNTYRHRRTSALHPSHRSQHRARARRADAPRCGVPCRDLLGREPCAQERRRRLGGLRPYEAERRTHSPRFPLNHPSNTRSS